MAEAKKTILLVEDETALREVLRDKFVQENFTVFEAKDGAEGLTVAFDKHPDIILLDLLMPEVSGLQVLEKLRSDDWGKSASVIVLTNVSDQEKIAEAVIEGSYEYIIKSDWKLEDIVAKVKDKLADTPTSNS